MTLKTSEELKKHESNLSMISFAKKKKKSQTKNPPTMEPKKWNRDDKPVTDYTPVHSCKISCAACRVGVFALVFKGF